MELKSKILNFLYDQVSQNKIPQIKKQMVEDFEAFIVALLADVESSRSAERMQNRVKELPTEEEGNETDSE